jgi:hypothetical protein
MFNSILFTSRTIFYKVNRGIYALFIYTLTHKHLQFVFVHCELGKYLPECKKMFFVFNLVLK